MAIFKRTVYLGGLFALFAAAGGCHQGPPAWEMAPVEGTITSGGQPVSRVEIAFYPDLDDGGQGPQSKAVTDDSGHYRLQAHNSQSGVVVGKHRVVITDSTAHFHQRGGPPPVPQGGGPPPGVKPSRIPINCADFGKTPLRVEIRSGAQVIDFDVKGASVEIKPIDNSGK